MLHRFGWLGFALALCLFSLDAQAQMESAATTPPPPRAYERAPKAELTGQYGYSFGAIIRTYEGDVTLEGSSWYGGTVGFFLKPSIILEATYLYRTGGLSLYNGNPWTPGTPDLNATQVTTQYAQIGSLKTFRKGKVAPFVGGQLGLGWVSSDVPNTDTDIYFTVSGLGGAKIYLSDKIGIRLQGRLLLPIFFGSMGFYCGTGGCGAGVGGSGTVEAELSTGIFLAF